MASQFRLSVCLSSVHPDLVIKLLGDFFHHLIAWLSDNFHVENHGHRPTGSPRRGRDPRGSQGRPIAKKANLDLSETVLFKATVPVNHY